MANPFGAADEALSKNTGHTNQANLLYAFIPRSTTKIVEVINALTINPAGGNYDADGFWRFNSTTRTENAFTITARGAGDITTVIVGVRYNAGGDVNIGIGEFAGFFQSGDATNNRFFGRFYRYARNANAFIKDAGGSDASGLNTTLPDPGADTFALAVKHNGSNAQSAFSRHTATSTSIGTDSTTALSSDGGLNRFGVWSGTKYAYQYIFAYNAYLSDADIEAIMDNPGSVIDVTGGGGGGGVPKTNRIALLGVG